MVRLSEIEDLCENEELAKYFPADFVNLDFCGQGFVFPDLGKLRPDQSEYQRRWNCVKQALKFNRQKEKNAWYLLLTLACNRNNAAGKRYLLEQLDAVMELSGVTKDPTDWGDNRLIQEVVPKIVADEALLHDYIPVSEAFDSYRYVQAEHRFQMVAWKFKFTLDAKKSLGQNVVRRKQQLEKFSKAYFATDAKELEIAE